MLKMYGFFILSAFLLTNVMLKNFSKAQNAADFIIIKKKKIISSWISIYVHDALFYNSKFTKIINSMYIYNIVTKLNEICYNLKLKLFVFEFVRTCLAYFKVYVLFFVVVLFAVFVFVKVCQLFCTLTGFFTQI